MTADEALALGRRVKACRGFRWIESMCLLSADDTPRGRIGDRIGIELEDGRLGEPVASIDWIEPIDADGLVPGCVRDARNEPLLYAIPVSKSDGYGDTVIVWQIREGGSSGVCAYDGDDLIAEGVSEVGAWVGAWEKA